MRKCANLIIKCHELLCPWLAGLIST